MIKIDLEKLNAKSDVLPKEVDKALEILQEMGIASISKTLIDEKLKTDNKHWYIGVNGKIYSTYVKEYMDGKYSSGNIYSCEDVAILKERYSYGFYGRVVTCLIEETIKKYGSLAKYEDFLSSDRDKCCIVYSDYHEKFLIKRLEYNEKVLGAFYSDVDLCVKLCERLNRGDR